MLTSLEEHRAMLKAIGDAQAAEAAGRHHLAQTLPALIDSLTGQDLAVGANVQPDVAAASPYFPRSSEPSHRVTAARNHVTHELNDSRP